MTLKKPLPRPTSEALPVMVSLPPFLFKALVEPARDTSRAKKEKDSVKDLAAEKEEHMHDFPRKKPGWAMSESSEDSSKSLKQKNTLTFPLSMTYTIKQKGGTSEAND